MKLPDLASFATLLSVELAAIDSPAARSFAKSILIEPWQRTLRWEYGSGEPFEAWVFADFKERDAFAAYCLGGHGARGLPWGLVSTDDDSFGMDCSWYPTLHDLIEEWVLEA